MAKAPLRWNMSSKTLSAVERWSTPAKFVLIWIYQSNEGVHADDIDCEGDGDHGMHIIKIWHIQLLLDTVTWHFGTNVFLERYCITKSFEVWYDYTRLYTSILSEEVTFTIFSAPCCNGHIFRETTPKRHYLRNATFYRYLLSCGAIYFGLM